jgi:TonB family protein
MSRFPSWALCMVAALPLPVRAEQAAAGVVTRAPQLLEAAQPEYPQQAQAEGVSGEVTLKIDISETGEVVAANVTSSPGHGLDEPARVAARRLRFSPAEIDGKPAAVRIEYRFRFELKPAPARPEATPTEPGSAEAGLPAVNFRGRVVERGTKVPLAGVAIQVNEGAATLTSDAQGRFEARGIPQGTARIVAFESAHARFETRETITEGKVTEVTYYLFRTSRTPFETVVVGEKGNKDVSTVAISVGEINRIAGVSGDAVKVVENLPGAARSPMGSGALILRGSGPLDSKVYIDGLEVPIVFHLGALYSVYSTELLKDVEFEPGNVGVPYGRATGGRVELKTRDPDTNRLHLVGDVSTYHANLMAEGPLTNGLSVAVAARRSYVDLLLKEMSLFTKTDDNKPRLTIAPTYYDYQGKVTWTPAESDTVRLNVFGANDAMAIVGLDDSPGRYDFDSMEVKTRFVRGALSWEHRFGPATRMKVLLAEGFDQQIANFGTLVRQTVSTWTTALRAEGSHEIHRRLSLRLGFDGQLAKINVKLTSANFPLANQMPNSIDPGSMVMNETFRLTSPGAWLEAVFRPWDRLALVPGIRVDHGSFFNATWADPRFSARWNVVDGTSLKGAAGMYHQFLNPFYLSREFGNPDLKPEAARQYSVGVEQKIVGPLSANVQGYFIDKIGQLAGSTQVVVRDGQTVLERYDNRGTGKAYGVEVMLRYNSDERFFGWLAWSWARSTRNASREGGMVWGTGDTYDQPLSLTALGSLELPEVMRGLSVGFRLRFGSGNPYTPISKALYDVDADQYSGIPSNARARLPSFFQLDLRIDKKITFKTTVLVAYFEVQNVTNHQNGSDYPPTYNFDYSQRQSTPGLPILPAGGLHFEY